MRKEEKAIKIINMVCVAAATFTVIPLLNVGHYNYPSADDWSLGKLTYQAVQNKEGIIGVLMEAVNTVFIWREKGEPRYANAFFGAM